MIVLGTHTKVWLQVQRSEAGFERQVDGAESRASRGQAVVNVCRFRLTLEALSNISCAATYSPRLSSMTPRS